MLCDFKATVTPTGKAIFVSHVNSSLLERERNCSWEANSFLLMLTPFTKDFICRKTSRKSMCPFEKLVENLSCVSPLLSIAALPATLWVEGKGIYRWDVKVWLFLYELYHTKPWHEYPCYHPFHLHTLIRSFLHVAFPKETLMVPNYAE